MYTYMCTHMHTHTHMYILYIHTHVHIHVYTHAHTTHICTGGCSVIKLLCCALGNIDADSDMERSENSNYNMDCTPRYQLR